MPTDSPQPRPQVCEDSGFAQAAFEELQSAYPKDPARFARMYNELKSDADNAFFNEEVQADSCQKLCLLDLAVANIKANSSDHQSAVIMFKDAEIYLDKLKSMSGGVSAANALIEIADKVKRKI